MRALTLVLLATLLPACGGGGGGGGSPPPPPPPTFDASFNSPKGFNNTVRVVAPVPDGSGDMFVAGLFTDYGAEGGAPANRIVRIKSDGSVNTSFDTVQGFDNTVFSLVATSTGAVFAAGLFTTYRGTSANRIVRIFQTGFIHGNFNYGLGFNAVAYATALAPDATGDLYVGGDFTSYDGFAANRIVRLNASGSIDPGFVVGTGFNAIIYSIVPAVDGSGDIYVAGDFTSYKGTPVNRIVRLNSDGSIDAGFVVGTGFNVFADAIAIAPDGSNDLYVTGDFTLYNGTARNRLVRLNSNGTIDAAFNVGTGFDTAAYALYPDAAGDLYVGGLFTTYNGTAAPRIVRLTSTGTINAAFVAGTGFDNTVISIADAGSGDLYIGGQFSTYKGNPARCMVKLNADGSVDSGLPTAPGFNNSVLSISPLADGTCYFGGAFTTYNGLPSSGIARLTANGLIDSSFVIGTGLNGAAYAMTVAGTGDLYIGGNFTTYKGAAAVRIARLDPDGTLDAAFVATADAAVQSILLAPDGTGDIYIGGFFANVNGTARSGIARLNPDGTLDAAFNPGTGFSGGAVQSVGAALDGSGDLYVGGAFTMFNGAAKARIARLNADGTVDNGFAIGTGFDASVLSVALAQDGSGDVYAGGLFTTYQGVAGRTRILRLNADGSFDAGFASGGPDSQVITVVAATDGSGDIYLGGSFVMYNAVASPFVVRANSNGAIDAAFSVGLSFNNTVNAIAVGVDGWGDVFIGGDFTTYRGVKVDYAAALDADGSMD